MTTQTRQGVRSVSRWIEIGRRQIAVPIGLARIDRRPLLDPKSLHRLMQLNTENFGLAATNRQLPNNLPKLS